jgi:small-conductance mechanosensitive channel
MNAFLERQIRGALAPLEEAAHRLLRGVALGLVALLALLAALVFLTVAAYVWLAELTGAILAAVYIAAAYIVIALICLFALRAGTSAKAAPKPAQGPAQANAKEAPDKAQTESATSAPPSEQDAYRAAEIDRALAPILDVLEDAGLQKANLGVEVAGEIAKQMKPFTLVAIAFVAGLLFGRRGSLPRG